MKLCMPKFCKSVTGGLHLPNNPASVKPARGDHRTCLPMAANRDKLVVEVDR